MSSSKHITSTKPENKTNRRNFLLGATLGTAGAVAAVVTATVAPVADVVEASAKVEPKKSKGYHVTAHIEQYYETARM
jgi:multidrug efflux pump subunit AcrA (membrane-fusion protein)